MIPAVLRQHPAFARLWAGSWISAIGSNLTFMVFPVALYDLTGSAAGFAGVMAATTLGMLITMPVGGALTDRFDRKRLIVAGDIALIPCVLALGVAYATEQVWLFAPIVFLKALIGGLTSSGTALQRDILGEEHWPSANALQQVGQNATQLAAPLLGVALYAAAGFTTVLAVDVATFVLSILLVAGVSDPKAAERRARNSESARSAIATVRRTLIDVRGGLRLARRDAYLRVQLGSNLFNGIGNGMFIVLMVPWLTEVLGLPTETYAALISTLGVTGLVTALVFTKVGGSVSPQRLIVVSTSAVPLIAAGFAFGAHSLALVVVALLACGVANVLMSIGSATIRQGRFESDAQGRVGSLEMNTTAIAQLVGIVAAGALLSGMTTQGVMYALVGTMAIGSILDLVALRHLSTPAPRIADDGTLLPPEPDDQLVTERRTVERPTDAELAVSG